MVSITILAGCGSATAVDESEPAPRRESAQAAMIGRVTKALDTTFTAEYAWSEGGTVTVWAAEDGTWRVDVPGWAHGGEVDVSVAWTTGGFFQCAEEECVKLAGITGRIPERFDPKVQRPFVEWLPLLLDRHMPFSVTREGDCFTLTPNTVVVETPFPPGEWCLDRAGAILSVTGPDVGELALEGEPEAPVETVQLPGEVVEGDPLGRKAPKPPKPETPTPSPSPTVTTDSPDRE